jgi:hypothetical protein
MKMLKKLAMLTFGATLLTLTAQAQFAGTGTTSVSVTVGAEAALQVNTATTTLANVGTIFNSYTGTTNFTYKVRTTKTGGTGTITLQVTSDFSPANGPSIATPPTAGDAMTYTCTATAPATACSGSLTSSTSAATSVATFGTNAHSANAGNTGSVAWSLTDDPTYQTGAYSATVTFTISAA